MEKELNVCWVGVYTMIAISFEVVISSRELNYFV